MRPFITTRLLTFFALTLVLPVLVSCGDADAASLAPVSALPEFAKDTPQRVQEAYRFAIAHPDDLETIPCYCGCGAMGHTSNLQCYISGYKTDGTPVFDEHAAGCGICVDITQDVMRLMDEDRSPQEIRAFIDATYSPYGPSTNTPLP